MSVMVAVGEGAEGVHVLAAGAAEATRLDAELVVVNLSLSTVDPSLVPGGAEVVERRGAGDRDPAEAVLDEIDDRGDVERLVIGVRRRSPVSKAILGSISQRLLLECPVPVLAVKPPA